MSSYSMSVVSRTFTGLVLVAASLAAACWGAGAESPLESSVSEGDFEGPRLPGIAAQTPGIADCNAPEPEMIEVPGTGYLLAGDAFISGVLTSLTPVWEPIESVMVDVETPLRVAECRRGMPMLDLVLDDVEVLFGEHEVDRTVVIRFDPDDYGLWSPAPIVSHPGDTEIGWYTHGSETPRTVFEPGMRLAVNVYKSPHDEPLRVFGGPEPLAEIFDGRVFLAPRSVDPDMDPRAFRSRCAGVSITQDGWDELDGLPVDEFIERATAVEVSDSAREAYFSRTGLASMFSDGGHARAYCYYLQTEWDEVQETIETPCPWECPQDGQPCDCECHAECEDGLYCFEGECSNDPRQPL